MAVSGLPGKLGQDVVGSFEVLPTDGQYVECGSATGAVCHTRARVQSRRSTDIFTWKAPSPAVGVVTFHAVIVSGLTTWYGKQDLILATLAPPPSADGSGGGSDITEATEYAALDGTGNNEAQPLWGSASRPFSRLVPAAAASPAPAAPAPLTLSPSPLSPSPPPSPSSPPPARHVRPSARAVSNAVFGRPWLHSGSALSQLVLFWGEFVAHDMSESRADSASTAAALPIPVPRCDHHYDFHCTGTQTMAFNRSISSPAGDAINHQTAFIDGSHIYGTTAERSRALRTLSGGRMRVGEGGTLPPTSGADGVAVEMDTGHVCPHLASLAAAAAGGATSAAATAATAGCVGDLGAAGGRRANENPVLSSLHAVFLREHNRWCTVLAVQRPAWDDDKLFLEARRRVVALIQKITYHEYLPALLGRPLPRYSAYRPSSRPQTSHLFATVAARHAHSSLPRDVTRLGTDGRATRDGALLLRDSIYAPLPTTTATATASGSDEGAVEQLLRGASLTPPLAPGGGMVSDLRNHLFAFPRATLRGGGDLAARDIQRGRDHRLPGLNTIRAALGLPPHASWLAVTGGDNSSAATLHALYGAAVEEGDPYVAALMEPVAQGSCLGPTLSAAVERQFLDTRDSDRFYFENSDSSNAFSAAELSSLFDARLLEVLRRNTALPSSTAAGAVMPPNVFFTGSGAGGGDAYPPPLGFQPAHTAVILPGSLRLLWTGDETGVEFMVQARTRGWVGIGFSPAAAGAMLGADCVLGFVGSDGSGSAADYYAADQVARPVLDTSLPGGRDDVTGAVLYESGGWTSMRFRKPRLSDSAGDKPIPVDAPIHLIFAYHAASDELLYHGPHVASAQLAFPADTKLPVFTLSPLVLVLGHSLCGLCFLFIAAVLVGLVRYRKHSAVRYANPLFSCLLLLGGLLMQTVPLLFLQPATPLLCAARGYLFSASFAMLFGALLTKTFRVVFILSQAHTLRRVRVKLSMLLSCFGSLLAMEVLTSLATALLAAPVSAAHVEDPGGSYTVDVCTYPVEYSVCFLTIKIAVLATGLLLSFRIRHAPKDFNDARYIALAIYNVTLCSAVFLPAASLLAWQLDAFALLAVVGLSWGASSSVGLLFLPVLLGIRRKDDAYVTPVYSVRTAGAHGIARYTRTRTGRGRRSGSSARQSSNEYRRHLQHRRVASRNAGSRQTSRELHLNMGSRQTSGEFHLPGSRQTSGEFHLNNHSVGSALSSHSEHGDSHRGNRRRSVEKGGGGDYYSPSGLNQGRQFATRTLRVPNADTRDDLKTRPELVHDPQAAKLEVMTLPGGVSGSQTQESR